VHRVGLRVYLAACGGGATPSALAPAVPVTAAGNVETEARQILDELLAVDTSHGNETKALTPIAARFKQAGVPVEIFESAPGRGNLVARVRGNGSKRRCS